MAHPAIAEAAAVGVPDAAKGESLVVFVVLREGYEPGDTLRSEIEQTIVNHIGKSLKPHAVRFARELPHTRNGKILRRLVRRAYLGEPPGDLSSLENPSGLEAITSAL
jgi:acetyl-CoA synthetase